VDAWAGLDPHMAAAELENGAVLFFRNPDFNTYGVLNVREAFAAEHPDLVKRVLSVYEKARRYAVAHPDELKAVLVEAAKLSDAVAEKQLKERTDLSNPVLGEEHRKALVEAGRVLHDIGVLKPGTDVGKTVDSLVDRSFSGDLAAR
jgi:sulfonate transport system substrate-binding protein